jgi:hypothetical protein
VNRKVLVLVLGVAGSLGVSGGSALAQPVNQLPPNNGAAVPGLKPNISNTNVSGVIAVTPNALNDPMAAGYSCATIDVYAMSKAMVPADATSPAHPKWIRSVSATGTWTSGSCSYSFLVPAATGVQLPTLQPVTDRAAAATNATTNDENTFSLFVHLKSNHCDGLANKNTPWMIVPKGQVKVVNLTALGTLHCLIP